MKEQKFNRRLAAILAADAVGYSGRMEEDEDATITAWLAARTQIIDPKISSHNGRIVKHTGDGFLAEFPTITDAVKCAIAIQTELKRSNEARPETFPLKFRMGVNLGDIMVDADDIHGDGVNIAARLEGLAEAGGICVSHAVYEQTYKRLEVGYVDLGEQRVKNIKSPIHAYQLLLDPSEAGVVVKRQITPADTSRAIICFVDDDPVEVEIFQRVFGVRYQVYASTNLNDLAAEIRASGLRPNLIVLDLYFPVGRNSTVDERIQMINLKQRVDDAQRELTKYLAEIGQGREGGLQLFKEARQMFPGTPISFFTRKGTIDDVVACLDAGAVHVLKKPQPNILNPNADLLPQLEQAARDSMQSLSTQLDRLLASDGFFQKVKNALKFVRQNWERF